VFFAASFFIKPLRVLIPHRLERPKETRFWYRWSRFIQHRPWPSALGAVLFLVVLAIPLFSIRLGFGDYGNYPEDKTVRRAYDLLAEGFGPARTARSSSPSRARPPTTPRRSTRSPRRSPARTTSPRPSRPAADRRRALARHRLPPRARPRTPRRRRSSTPCATTSSQPTGVDAKVGGFTPAPTTSRATWAGACRC
jgi:hypothetical protein